MNFYDKSIYTQRFIILLKQYRKFKKLSQLEMALKLDMDQSTYCLLEHGKYRITLELFITTSEVLTVTPAAMLSCIYRNSNWTDPSVYNIFDPKP